MVSHLQSSKSVKLNGSSDTAFTHQFRIKQYNLNNPTEQPTPKSSEPSEASPMLPKDQVNPQNNPWFNPQSFDNARQPAAKNPDQPLTNQEPSFGMAPPTFTPRQNQGPKVPRPAGIFITKSPWRTIPRNPV